MLKCVHVLIPGTIECIRSHGKVGIKVTDGIKFATKLIFKGEDYPELSGWTQCLRSGRVKRSNTQREI